MKTQKLILTFALLFLVLAPFVAADNSVAGLLVYEDTDDTTITVETGDSTGFLVWGYGFLEDYILVSVDLLDDSGNQITNIHSGKYNRQSENYDVEFSDTLSLSAGTAGTYTLELTVIGESGAKTTHDLTLIVESTTTTTGSAPTIAISSPQNGNTYDSLSTLFYSANDVDGDLDTCWYSDGSTTSDPVSCSEGSNAFTINPSEGSNTYTVYAQDFEGNTAQDEVTFTIDSTMPDTTAPAVSISNPLEGNVYTSEITNLYYSATDENLDTCWYSTDEGETNSTPVSCSSSFAVTSDEGINIWTVYAQDTAGNVGSDSVTFVVNTLGDTTAPTISIASPSDEEELDFTEVDFRVYVNEDVSSVVYSINDGENKSMTETSAWTYEATEELEDESDYTLTVYATDMYGNTASKTITFTIDEVADSDDESRASVTVDDKKWKEQFDHKKPKITLEEDDEKELNWWQKFINWLCRVFGLTEIY